MQSILSLSSSPVNAYVQQSSAAKKIAPFISLPKSGTRMLQEILKGMNLQPQRFQQKYLHFWQLKEVSQKNVPIENAFKGKGKVICLYRDPRDNLVSLINYVSIVEKNPDGDKRLGKAVNFDEWNKLSSTEKVSELLHGGAIDWPNRNVPSIRSIIKLKEANLQNVLFVRFEDIVGEQAGGAPIDTQKAEFKRIYRFFVPNASSEKIDRLVNKALKEYFGQSSTYNPKESKKVGQWEKYFNQEQVDFFKENYNDLLTGLGYEQDDQWNLPGAKQPAGSSCYNSVINTIGSFLTAKDQSLSLV